MYLEAKGKLALGAIQGLDLTLGDVYNKSRNAKDAEAKALSSRPVGAT